MLPYFQNEFLRLDIQYLKGVGPKLSKKFRNINISTIGDLLFYPPLRYEDHSNMIKISEVEIDESAGLELEILNVLKKRIGYRKMLDIKATDGSGYIHLIFFNRNFFAEKLKPLEKIMAYGKVIDRRGQLQIVHPELAYKDSDEEDTLGIVPIYSTTDGLKQSVFKKCFKNIFSNFVRLQDVLPDIVKKQYLLLDLMDALRNLHFPEDMTFAEASKKRLIFEEFFYFQLGLLLNKTMLSKIKVPKLIGDDSLCDKFINGLSFSLTNAQNKAWNRIKELLSSDSPMRALLQGDVGSGKTVVAYLSLLKAIECGFQGAFLAPTEVLAEQQFIKFKNRFGHLINIDFLSSSVKGKKRKNVLERLKNKEIDVLIGTHAIIEDNIEFDRLGLAIIDEQHRFGVEQRERLLKKGENIDLLVMTATPIPRTLSLTLYGEMEIIYLDELPGGRKKIKTLLRTPSKLPAIYDFIIKEVESGHKAFIVCPLVDESEVLDLNHVIGVYEKINDYELKDIDVGFLHGRMKSKEKEETMKRFRDGEFSVLVSTTVIEVGVDIPEATIMIILNAERFGISQLHQLRGRVGRSELQAYCALVSESLDNPRLQALAETNDGFELAELDLRLRGPGEFLGTHQHGALDFRIGDIVKDKDLLLKAREAARNYIQTDSELDLLDEGLLRFLSEKFEFFHERLS